MDWKPGKSQGICFLILIDTCLNENFCQHSHLTFLGPIICTYLNVWFGRFGSEFQARLQQNILLYPAQNSTLLVFLIYSIPFYSILITARQAAARACKKVKESSSNDSNSDANSDSDFKMSESDISGEEDMEEVDSGESDDDGSASDFNPFEDSDGDSDGE
jgi:hypothetical protein